MLHMYVPKQLFGVKFFIVVFMNVLKMLKSGCNGERELSIHLYNSNLHNIWEFQPRNLVTLLSKVVD